MWKRIGIGAAVVLALVGASGVGFTLHQRGQCERLAGLWYDALPDGRVGLDPQQVDWRAAYQPCSWASQFMGAPLHKMLFARAFARQPIGEGEAADVVMRQRAPIVDRLILEALPAYPYGVFESGMELLAQSEVALQTGDRYVPPSAEQVAAFIRLLTERAPVERAAYDKLIALARGGDRTAALLAAMRSGGHWESPAYLETAFEQRALAMAVLGQAAPNGGDNEAVVALRGKPGAVEFAQRLAEALAPVAPARAEPPSIAESNGWILSAAHAEYAPAQYVAASLRNDVVADAPRFSITPAEFTVFLRGAAGQSFAPAQYELARVHIGARNQTQDADFLRAGGIAPSPGEALRLLRLADDAGFAPATIALGDGHLLGWFGQSDPDQALSYYERGARR